MSHDDKLVPYVLYTTKSKHRKGTDNWPQVKHRMETTPNHRNRPAIRAVFKIDDRHKPSNHKPVWAASWQNQQSDCVPSEDSDQPGHPPSLTRVFAVRTKEAWVLSYPLSTQRRLWSDLADAQADLSLRWAHIHIVGFVMRRFSVSNDRVVRP